MIVAAISFLLSTVFMMASYIAESNYIHEFLDKNLIEVMGVILAINCASASSLHLNLVAQEHAIDEECFTSTKKEIRENAFFSVVGFVANLFLLFLASFFKNKIFVSVLDGVALWVFLLYIYALYELTIRYILNIKPLTTK